MPDFASELIPLYSYNSANLLKWLTPDEATMVLKTRAGRFIRDKQGKLRRIYLNEESLGESDYKSQMLGSRNTIRHVALGEDSGRPSFAYEHKLERASEWKLLGDEELARTCGGTQDVPKAQRP